MGEFLQCIEHILKEEGGYSNHPDDPGGETKYGISKRAYPHLNIASLTSEQAQHIYYRDYWQQICGDELPSGLDLLVFDCAVNQGVGTAIRLLQKVCHVGEDGVLGPITIKACQTLSPDLLTNFAAERALRYEFNKNESTFGRGWYRRLLWTHFVARTMAGRK